MRGKLIEAWENQGMSDLPVLKEIGFKGYLFDEFNCFLAIDIFCFLFLDGDVGFGSLRDMGLCEVPEGFGCVGDVLDDFFSGCRVLVFDVVCRV